MTLKSFDVARAMGAPYPESSQERAALPDEISGWSVDTRTLDPGDLYFALKGSNHDGHQFVEAALGKGAAAAVVEVGRLTPSGSSPRTWAVADTLRALQELSRWARDGWAGVVIGVTGSAGKTTTKDAIADLLSVEMPVGRTIGNLNNHVGVPLSILRLPDAARAAVLEIGMNHAGEIRELAAIARPDIGVVTNVGYAHVEFFEKGIEGVAAAKRELIEALPRHGIAVLNGDDARVRAFRDVHPGRSIIFGFSEFAEVRAENWEETPAGARFRALGVEFETTMAGRHAVMNLAAAIAVARIFGIAPERLREPVRSFSSGRMRGERIEHNGIVIWDDCYNSNPEAARSMIDVLGQTPAARRIAVLGEMLELGRASEELHRQVGRYAAEHGVDFLVGVRGNSRAMVDAAVGAGLPRNAAFFVEESSAAGEMARGLAKPGDAILFKGSRGVKVERALERFLGAGGGKAGDGGWGMGGGEGRLATLASFPKSYMLYYLLYEKLYQHVSPFRVFRYTTFRTAFASLTALFLCIALGPWLIGKLRQFQIGQYIREEGPKSHRKKAGTPTMGGVLIIISIVIPTLLWADLRFAYVWIAIAALLGYGFIGFLDDYIKVTGRRNLGLSGKRKLVYQFTLGFAFSAILLVMRANGQFSISMNFPFFKQFKPSLLIPALLTNPWTYVLGVLPFCLFVALVVVFSSNAVNLTDGLDGLAIGLMVIAAGALTMLTYAGGHAELAEYLQLARNPHTSELTIFCGSMTGASLGFLWYNAHPAEIFMGDVGSLGLGGAMAVVAVLIKQEVLLLFIGGIFILEAVSVILQVGSYRLRHGKRIFKMAPLHHHFEALGWTESKIIARFWIAGLVLALFALTTLKLR